ncbi:LAME_0H09076g1_1 [Lachancea meyersii CBS 8951]|uniref:LAME_0H09076g1_1 n=1 Tax=Lachancea meyersii CBS 8951 TaxID=1266667 RepID=A0A1G4KG03_9SACH|nr:LAME_0H09076g1_1 [Lachancea meyersii CBS 8951]
MGYVKSGYATRPNKRAKKVREKVYYEHIRKHRHKELKSAERQANALAKKRPVRLQDLPQDVLERIFVFSGRNSPLPLLNRHFSQCLQPTPFLIEQYLRANFVSDANAALKTRLGDTYWPWYVLADCALENPMFLRYLNATPSFLNPVDEIAPVEAEDQTQQLRLQQYNEGTLKELATPLLPLEFDPATNKPLRDFPASVYEWPAIFFDNDISAKPVVYNQLLLRLHFDYAIQHPSWVAESIMHWFFLDSHGAAPRLDVNHLFFALNLIIHISVQGKRSFADSHPLAVFIDFLYVSVTPHLLQLLLCEKLDDAQLISARKAKMVSKFIRKFCSHDFGLLCEDELWVSLNAIKDHALVETITKYGGKPSFNVVK